MAKIIQTGITPLQAKEARLVEGMMEQGRPTQYEFYAYCADYFWNSYHGVFFADEVVAAEILQNAFIVLWEKIENRKIYVHEDRIMGCDGQPLKSSILTFFMSIARNKYREYVRGNVAEADFDTEQPVGANRNDLIDVDDSAFLYDSDENVMIDILAEVIADMSPKCYEILTKFYYEEKNLEVILSEIDSIESKDALKTKKYKCMEKLRHTVKNMYSSYLRSSSL